jgi:hypothetical protein
MMRFDQVAERLQLNRQQLSILRGNPAFPAPIVVRGNYIAIWEDADIAAFLVLWDVARGRGWHIPDSQLADFPFDRV